MSNPSWIARARDATLGACEALCQPWILARNSEKVTSPVGATISSTNDASRDRLDAGALPVGPLRPADATRGLVGRIIEIDAREVVFFKSIVEASEGVASIFGQRGGVLWVAAPSSRVAALDDLLDDLGRELTLRSLAWVDGVDAPDGGLDG